MALFGNFRNQNTQRFPYQRQTGFQQPQQMNMQQPQRMPMQQQQQMRSFQQTPPGQQAMPSMQQQPINRQQAQQPSGMQQTNHSGHSGHSGQQGRQLSQMPQPQQTTQMPQLPQQQMPQLQMPQSNQHLPLPQQMFQQPSPSLHQQQMPQHVTPPQPPQTQNNTLDSLKKIGTFMGYPEYTLPDASIPNTPPPATAPKASSQPMQQPSQQTLQPPIQQPLSKPSLQRHNEMYDMFQNMRELIQSEKNGSEFYKNLAEISGSDTARFYLTSISDRARSRSDRLKEMHNSLYNDDFSPENKELARTSDYREGLKYAIKEESVSLRNYAQFAEKTADPQLRSRLNDITIEKLCQINELNLLKND